MNLPYTKVPAPQKYLTIKEIREKYGGRSVLAHSCKTRDTAPIGGHVFAVANEIGKGRKELIKYRNAIREKRPDLNPIYHFCLDDGGVFANEVDDTAVITSITAVENLADIQVREHPAIAALRNMPDDMLAAALKTAVASD